MDARGDTGVDSRRAAAGAQASLKFSNDACGRTGTGSVAAAQGCRNPTAKCHPATPRGAEDALPLSGASGELRPAWGSRGWSLHLMPKGLLTRLRVLIRRPPLPRRANRDLGQEAQTAYSFRLLTCRRGTWLARSVIVGVIAIQGPAEFRMQ